MLRLLQEPPNVLRAKDAEHSPPGSLEQAHLEGKSGQHPDFNSMIEDCSQDDEVVVHSLRRCLLAPVLDKLLYLAAAKGMLGKMVEPKPTGDESDLYASGFRVHADLLEVGIHREGD